MLDLVVQPVNDGNKRSRPTLPPYQSVWLAHWKRTSCDAAGDTCNPDASRRKELDNVTVNDDLTKGLEGSSRCVVELGMTKGTASEIGDEIIQISSESEGVDRNDIQALKFERGKGIDWKSVTSCYTLVKLQNCVHDVETMRICAANDQLITKRADVNAGSNSTVCIKALDLDSNMLPDINMELHALPGAASSSKNTHQNSSKHVEQPKPKYKFNLNDLPNADPGNKYAKRLKLSSSNPSLKDEEQQMENPKDKGNALLFSHAWIRRWIHNGQGVTEVKKPEMNVVCWPQSSKLRREKLEKEQLPSTAAMALMAKALTCFQPCELQKRGPFTIWNTKTF